MAYRAEATNKHTLLISTLLLTKARANKNKRLPCIFQIGSLKGYYLFHHRHISKRSLSISDVHHDALNTEPEVSNRTYTYYIYIYNAHINTDL